jgi:hypothetical protein
LLSFGGRADDDGDDGWARRRHEAVAAAESLVACLNWSNSDEKPDIVAAGAGSPRGRAGGHLRLFWREKNIKFYFRTKHRTHKNSSVS